MKGCLFLVRHVDSPASVVLPEAGDGAQLSDRIMSGLLFGGLMSHLRPFAASLSLALALTVLGTAAPRADEASVFEPEPNWEETVIGPYFAGLIAGLRGDAANSADYLLEVVSKVEPAHEVLGPALRASISAGRIEDAVLVAEALLALDPEGSEPAALLLFTRDVRDEAWEAARDRLEALPAGNLSATRGRLLNAWVTLPLEGVDRSLEILAPLADRRGLEVLHDVHAALLLDVAGRPEAKEAYAALMEEERTPSGRSILLTSNFLARNGDQPGALAIIDQQLTAGRGNATLSAVRDELAALKDGEGPAPLVGSVGDGLSEVFLQIGAALADDGPEELALQESRMASYAAPHSTAAILLTSEVLSRLDRHDEAVAGYERLLDDPRHGVVAALARADALAAAERVEEALEAYQALADSLTDNPEPVLRMGNLLRWERRFEESAAAYDEAVARSGEVDQGEWLLYYFRGISNERSGSWDEAEADFLLALELQPDQPQVLNYLGYSWVEQRKNLDQAKSMLEKAVELRPRDGYIVDSLGWALYQLGDFEGAVTHLERAAELEPGQAVINDHLGDAYWRVGRKREADVQWRRTLSLGEDPDIDPADVELKLREGLPPLDETEKPDKDSL